MNALVSYRFEDSVATITMDDGKVNVLSPAMISELDHALDRATADEAVVVLTSTARAFSAGFDLGVLARGGAETVALVSGGFELAARLLSFPRPVVIACNGHAVAMGVFLLLSGDYRVGAAGSYKITANEVALGLPMPGPAIEICRQRLAPAHFNRAVLLAEVYSPDDAVAAGFLDRVVPAAELGAAAQGVAAELAKLDMDAHATTKLRVREESLTRIRAAIGSAAGLGVPPERREPSERHDAQPA
ncbi:MAG TPA: crotonase/enoyl-CoA hydratase family protein [Streptosporangiaceae bacterium]|nr:crotonase/enoyl-CoA hydratase family protein [Streptosporangiaceae bacterium]